MNPPYFLCRTQVISVFKDKVKKSIRSLEQELKCNDLEDETIDLFKYKINFKIDLLNYESEKEVFEYCKKESNWFLDIFLKKNTDKSKEILSVIIYLYFRSPAKVKNCLYWPHEI